MLQATPKAKAKLRPPDAAARFAIEKALQQRRYCKAFAPRRACRNKQCRRLGACCGDANVCLKLGLAHVPHDVQWRVRQAIIDATPHNIGAPERKARQSMPAIFMRRMSRFPGARGSSVNSSSNESARASRR